MNTNTTEPVKTNGAAAPSAQVETEASKIQSGSAEQEMLFSLKANIDKYGRYSNKLTDMAQGYAAGRGVPSTSARMAIEDKFANQFGRTPKQYLEQQFEQRKQHSRGR
ncbi:hypothetical protein MLD52_09640 [Puniceicoccaceae bacterium K14]|nr:hypothetical protein [Puniceicoccaceae bacterium K14]